MAVHGACLAALMVGAACDAADSGWGGSLVATSDYVFRGLSQTRGDPAAQVDLHYRGTAGWFVGGWASNIDPQADYTGSIELNAYVGWAWAPAPDWSTRLTYVRYLYPGESAGANYDYGELTGSIGYQDRVFATVGWSPDMDSTTRYGSDHRGTAFSYELSVRQPVWRWFGLAAGIGYYDLSDVLDQSYQAWNATLTCSFDSFELDLARFGTDPTARELFGRDTADGRWALTAIWRF
jgi:uncharacterized protein (TIGR02001 family)